MSEKREVSFEEFKGLRDNLKPGQALSVDFADGIDKMKNDHLEIEYGTDDLHEPEGYSMDFLEEQWAPISRGGIIVDDSDLEYNGEKIDLLSDSSIVK